jgi:hypothetical protein
MECLNSTYLDSSTTRSFELWHGDIAHLDFDADLLIISAIRSDYSPLKGTLIGALWNQLGLSVERLNSEPELEYSQPSGRLWVSKMIGQGRIGRILCVEIPYGGRNVDQIVQQAFRSLPMLEARGMPLRTICLPVLGTGGHGLNAESVLRPILEGSQWALRILNSAHRVCFVEVNSDRAKQMSVAMDNVLGRVKIALAKGPLVDAVRAEITGQLKKLDAIGAEARDVAERLRKAISEGSRSAEVGMAGRLLREFVVAQVLAPENIKKLTPFDTMQAERLSVLSGVVTRCSAWTKCIAASRSYFYFVTCNPVQKSNTL